MPTVEERLQSLEREHTELRKTIELQTIAIGALVNKATLEKLNEKYDRLFETLIAHDRFTNEQLASLRTQYTEVDGKIVGLQTEMRQRFSQVEERFDVIEERFSQVEERFSQVEERFSQVEERFNEQDNKITSLQTTQVEHTSILAEHTKLLHQILARLPEKLQ